MSVLLRGITSKHDGDFYCLNWKLKSPEKVWKNKDFCGIAMRSENDNILGVHQYMKSEIWNTVRYLCSSWIFN